jgi:membrane-associated phospholipid phosphatase
MINLLNSLSMSVGLLYVIPIILYLNTADYIHLKGFIGLIGITILSEFIKYNFVGTTSPRPKGARDCNLFCNDGKQEGQPGMPSSHSAEAAFFAAFYFKQTTNPILQSGLVLYPILVMISRYLKHCHTINQVVAGSLLGLCSAWIVRQL